MVRCDFCGTDELVMKDHEEEHLDPPRKVNICMGCHAKLHHGALLMKAKHEIIDIERWKGLVFERMKKTLGLSDAEVRKYYNDGLFFAREYMGIREDVNKLARISRVEGPGELEDKDKELLLIFMAMVWAFGLAGCSR